LDGGIGRVLDDNGYYPFRGEEKVVKYIKGMAADSGEGTDNLFRGIFTSLAV
jgi:hypothetical protein